MEFIVGIIVGGIPVVLEAYDRYWALSKVFSCFRNHASELDKLDTVSSTQKALFRGSVIKILSTLTRNPAKAHSLLAGDATWADLSSEPMLEIEADSDQIRLSRAEFSQKFRLCFRKEDIQRDIKELRDFVGDFTKLTLQIIEQLGDLDVKKPSAASLARRRPAYWNSLERYRQIQAASSSLYGTFAFQWSCAAHQQHMAIIALKSDGPLSLKQAEKFNTIRFDAVITPINAQSSPLCLEIEHVGITLNNQAGVPTNHTMTVEAKPDTSLSDMVGTLQTHSQRIVVDPVAERTPNKLKKRTPSSDPAPPKKKTVQFRPMSILSRETAPLSRTTEDDVPAVVEPPPLRNLSRIEEFCQHFDANRSMCSFVCIGYLRNTGIYRFYPPATPRAAISTRQKNLYEVMSEISNGQISRMLPITAAFHIARELACAVLQYRSTPWLPEVWHSSQVHLFDIDEVLRDPNSLHLPSPYFGAAFSKKQAPGQGPSVVVQYGIIKDLADARLSRNQMLFCLGIILLELGYGKTWPELRDSVAHKKPGQSMYQTAMSLSGSGDLVKKMGHEYPLVVQKCLGCDFARGDDLESEALQGAFLVDVVNVLWEQERILVEAHMKIFGAQESTPQTT